MRYAIVKSGTVTNVIIWNGDTTRWTPEPGQEAVPDPDGKAQIGGTYANGVFADPPPRVPEEAIAWEQIGPRELITAIIGAFRAEGVLTAARALSIRQRIADELKR